MRCRLAELQVQVQTLELRLSTVPHSESTRTNDVRTQLLGKQCALMQQLAEIDSQYSENTQVRLYAINLYNSHYI